MKTKEDGWIKGKFEILKYGVEKPQVIDDGRLYKFFGLELSGKFRTMYHVPTKTRIGTYTDTMQNIKELGDKLLAIPINWETTDKNYFQNCDQKTKDEINEIIQSLQ